MKAVTLEFFSIQEQSVRDNRAKFGICNLPQTGDIGLNSDCGISDFWISGQSLIKENSHNSRTSHDIDIKLRPVTKFDKSNRTTSKKFDVVAMSENCDVIVFFQIFGQFRAVQRPDFKHRV